MRQQPKQDAASVTPSRMRRGVQPKPIARGSIVLPSFSVIVQRQDGSESVVELGSQWSLQEMYEGCKLGPEERLVLSNGRTVDCVGDLTPGDPVRVLGLGGTFWGNKKEHSGGNTPGFNFVDSPLDNLTAPTERMPWRCRANVASTKDSIPAYGAHRWSSTGKAHWEAHGGRMADATPEMIASWLREDAALGRTYLKPFGAPETAKPSQRASVSRLERLAKPASWTPVLTQVWESSSRHAQAPNLIVKHKKARHPWSGSMRMQGATCLAVFRERLLISGGGSGELLVWDLESMERLGALSEPHRDVVHTLMIPKRAPVLISAGGDGDRSIKLWDLAGSSILQRAPIAVLSQMPGAVLALSMLGESLCAAGVNTFSEQAESNIMCWPLLELTSAATSRRKLPAALEVGGHQSSVVSLRSNHVDTLLSCGLDGVLIVWKLQHSSKITPVQMLRCKSGLFPTTSLMTDSRVLVGQSDGSVAEWRLADGVLMRTCTTAPRLSSGSVASKGTARAVSALVSVGPLLFITCHDGRVAVWDKASLEYVTSFHSQAASVNAAVATPNAPFLMAMNTGSLSVWAQSCTHVYE